jgi:hypothetical protein
VPEVPDSALPELATQLAKDVVTLVAPQELPLFSALSAAFGVDPDSVAPAASRRNEPLGFGIDTAVALMTPVVLAVVTAAVQQAAGDAGRAVGERGSKSAGRLMRRLSRKVLRRWRPANRDRTPTSAPDPLTVEQLARIHEVTVGRARQFGLPADKASLLADAIVGGLTLPSQPPARGE